MGLRKARPDDKLRAAPTEAFREAPMSRCRGLKIEGRVFFTLAPADRGGNANQSSGRFGA